MFHAAVCFAAGVVLARSTLVSATEFAAVAVAALLCALGLAVVASRAAFATALLAFVAMGGFVARLEQQNRPAPADIAAFCGEAMEITAHVTRTELPRVQVSGGEFVRMDVETETISDGTRATPVMAGVRLTIRNVKGFVPPRYGERIRFIAALREPRNYGNPGALDYRGYLLERGMVALASTPSQSIERLEGKVGSWHGALRARLREAFLARLMSLAQADCAKTSCLSRDDVAILAAMTIGEHSLIERETRVDFQKTGVFHILVVSGFNVGIVAALVFWMSRRLRAGDLPATLLTVALSLLYAYLTEMGPPIMRAALMLALFLIARLLYRERHSLNSIGTAALIMLVVHPPAIFDPSFQLTFLAVTALGGIVQPLLERSTTAYVMATRRIDALGFDASREPRLAQWRIDLRMIATRFGRLLPRMLAPYQPRLLAFVTRWALRGCELLILTVILQLALALPMVWYFHRLNVAGGIPANLVVVPLSVVLLPLALLTVLVAFVLKPIAVAVAGITALVLHAITGAVSMLASASALDLRLPLPTLPRAVLMVATVAFAMYSVRRERRWRAAGVAGLALGAVLLALPRSAEVRSDAAEVTAIDVGQGDALLVVEQTGHTLLVDGGGPPGYAGVSSFDIGEDVVSPYLWSRGFSRLDAVALTHPHSDHMQGLHAVIRNFRPQELWLGVEGKQVSELMRTAQRYGARIRRLGTGETIALGSARVNVIAADDDAIMRSANDESLVLRLEFGSASALLLGDAERDLERAVAASQGKVDFLKVAHHGSATSTTPELLAAVRPKVAVISAGKQNTYGHPRAEVLARLKASKAAVYRTDEHGAVTVYLRGGVVTTETYSVGP